MELFLASVWPLACLQGDGYPASQLDHVLEQLRTAHFFAYLTEQISIFLMFSFFPCCRDNCEPALEAWESAFPQTLESDYQLPNPFASPQNGGWCLSCRAVKGAHGWDEGTLLHGLSSLPLLRDGSSSHGQGRASCGKGFPSCWGQSAFIDLICQLEQIASAKCSWMHMVSAQLYHSVLGEVFSCI